MPARFAFCITAILALGCAETTLTCAEGLVRDAEGNCVADPVDSGHRIDAHTPMPDAGPDGGPCGMCPAEAPFCAVADGNPKCVECLDDDGCHDEAAPYCNTNNECRGCTDDEHCPGQCNGAGECVACETNDDCADRTDGNILCGQDRTAGECIACADSTDCATNESCDLFTGQCVALGDEPRGTCEPCTNDDQCASDHRCVEMTYDGEPHGEGGYCLQIAPAQCPRPFTIVNNGDSINGAEGPYCSVNEALTTCEAVLAARQECTIPTGEEEDSCPVGSTCRNILGVGDRCTYRCNGDHALCYDTSDNGNADTCMGAGDDSYCGPG